MTKKVPHTIQHLERAKGFLRGIHDVLDQFGKDHKFDGAHFTYLDGSEFAYAEHNKGPVHTHTGELGRVDGLTGGFDRMLTNPTNIEVWVDDNTVFIKEVKPKHTPNNLAEEAAKLRELLRNAKDD